MRVLVCHNRYQSLFPSGENAVVDLEVELLRGAGVEVDTLMPDSDALLGGSKKALLAAGLGPIRSSAGVAAFEQQLERKPDVVHLHNVFPFISPWVIRTARSQGIPVVQTVHNYRHTCVQGQHLRDERICTDCLGKRLAVQALRHGCYRGNPVHTIPMVAGQALHVSTWRAVARFLVLSQTQKDRIATYLGTSENIHLKPNAVRDHGPAPTAGDDVLFIGRLSHEKGIDLLLEAWAGLAESGRRLVIVGSGPLEDEVVAATQARSDVVWLGQQDAAGVRAAIEQAGVIAMPSVWDEPFGLVAVEAFAAGRPVIATTTCAPSGVVDEEVGWIAEPSAAGIRAALADSLQPGERGSKARVRYEQRYTPDRVLEQLLAHYEAVL